MSDTNGPAAPEEVENSIRARIEQIDQEKASIREQKKALTARSQALDAEKDRWQRMLPRAPRQRRPRVEQSS